MNGKKIAILQKRIDRIKKELTDIGDMVPGSLSTQLNVCGNPKCRCKDPKNPQKHGPYYQLSFSRKGKSSTRFIKKEEIEAVRQQVKNYAKFKELNDALIDVSMELWQLYKDSGALRKDIQ